MVAPSRAGSAWFVLVLALLCALLVGAAASTIAGASPLTTPYPPPGSPAFVADLLGWALVVGLAALVGFLLYRRMTTGSGAVPGRFVAMVLAVVLIATVFVAIAPFLHAGSGFLGSGGPIAPPPTSNPNGSGGSGSNLTGPGQELEVGFHAPSWVFFLIAIVIACVVAVAATPQGRAVLFGWRGQAQRARSREEDAERARQAMVQAADEIEHGGNPRAVIIALYGELLRRIGPRVGDLDAETPEEIRAQHLERLGIRPPAALDLTRLFEEARYSSHPMGPEAAADAIEILRTAVADLERSRPLP